MATQQEMTDQEAERVLARERANDAELAAARKVEQRAKNTRLQRVFERNAAATKARRLGGCDAAVKALEQATAILGKLDPAALPRAGAGAVMHALSEGLRAARARQERLKREV